MTRTITEELTDDIMRELLEGKRKDFVIEWGTLLMSEVHEALCRDNPIRRAATHVTPDDPKARPYGIDIVPKHELVMTCKIPLSFRENNGVDITPYILDKVCYGIVVREAQAMVTGNGIGKPLGVMSGAVEGVGISLKEMGHDDFFAPDRHNRNYVPGDEDMESLTWVMHKDVIENLRPIVDPEYNSIVRSSNVIAGLPARVKGIPVIESEYAPDSINDAPFAVVGNLKKYIIAGPWQIILRADKNDASIIVVSTKIDGMPIVDAFLRFAITHKDMYSE